MSSRIALLPDCHVSGSSLEASYSSLRPMRRLYPFAASLLNQQVRTLNRATAPGFDAIFLLGDTLDPADQRSLAWLRELIKASRIPIYPIIGNHEAYGSISNEQFHLALGLPAHGNYIARVGGLPFLMLATPGQDSLVPGSRAYRWLAATLKEMQGEASVFCCAHYSLLLHPCVHGSRNDGMQVLSSADAVLDLLGSHPNVRAWIAGHKNIPSKVITRGILHLLSPQLIQAPCGFRELRVSPHSIQSCIHPLADKKLARLSRDAYGAAYSARHGDPADRDFTWSWH